MIKHTIKLNQSKQTISVQLINNTLYVKLLKLLSEDNNRKSDYHNSIIKKYGIKDKDKISLIKVYNSKRNVNEIKPIPIEVLNELSNFNDKNGSYNPSIINDFINSLIITPSNIDVNKINFLDRNQIVYDIFINSNDVVLKNKLHTCTECNEIHKYDINMTEVKFVDVDTKISTMNHILEFNLPLNSEIHNSDKWLNKIINTKTNDIYENMDEIKDYLENNVTRKTFNALQKSVKSKMLELVESVYLISDDDIIKNKKFKCNVCGTINTIKSLDKNNKFTLHDLQLV